MRYLISFFIIFITISAPILQAVDPRHSCGSNFFEKVLASVVAPLDVYRFDSACQAHDLCYDEQRGRDLCDREFRKAVQKACPKLDLKCKANAAMFATAVEIGGKKAYKNAKK